MKKIIADTLKRCGVPTHILGYQYCGYAIELTQDDPSIIHEVTRRLYPAVAEHFNTTAIRVERAIRHSIEVAFNNMSMDLLLEIFGHTIKRDKGKATNTQFIATITEYISNQETAV